MTTSRLRRTSVLAAALVSSLLFSLSAQAVVVAHWRFEDGAFLEDSVGSHTLTNNTSVSQVSSPFNNPVPQTGAANGGAAAISGANYFTAADSPAFTSGQFTLETFFVAGDTSGTGIFAGQFGSGGAYANQRAYAFGISGGKLRLWVGTNSGQNTRQFNAFTLNNNVNYYAAVSAHLTSNSATAVTLYLQDLTNNGALQEFSFSLSEGVGSGPAITGIVSSTAPFSIGATAQGTSNFTGTLDEVRFSNTRLATSELLISVPEPGIAALLLLTGAGFVAFRRRR